MIGVIPHIEEALESFLAPSAMEGYSKKTAVYEPGTGSACTLILYFQPPEPWEVNFLCLQATQFMVLYDSSPNGLRQPKRKWITDKSLAYSKLQTYLQKKMIFLSASLLWIIFNNTGKNEREVNEKNYKWI